MLSFGRHRQRRMRRRGFTRGFTMVEVLTAIAIIAILAAILFPVFSTVRESTRKAQCRSNLQQIAEALKAYKNKNKVYPEALYAVSYNGGPLQPCLSGEFIQDRNVFTCPNHPQQHKNSDQVVPPVNPTLGQPVRNYRNIPIGYAARSSYDFQYRPYNTGTGTAEVHYNRAWTGAMQGTSTDPRQLIRRDPPGDTVVTWCLYHTPLEANGMPKPGSRALVLFLNGRIEEVPAERLVNWNGGNGNYPWQVRP